MLSLLMLKLKLKPKAFEIWRRFVLDMSLRISSSFGRATLLALWADHTPGGDVLMQRLLGVGYSCSNSAGLGGLPYLALSHIMY